MHFPGRQGRANGQGEQERMGCSGNAISALLRGKVHSTAPSHPQPCLGALRGAASLSLHRSLCEVSHTGTELPPPSPSAPALSLSELSHGMKAGTDSTLTPLLTHPDFALVTPVLSETLVPLSPCPCPPHPLCAAGSSVQLLPTPALTLPAPAS